MEHVGAAGGATLDTVLDRNVVGALLEGGPNGIKLLDAQDRVVWMNRRALRARGLDNLEAVYGQPFVSLWPDTDPSLVRRALVRARQSGLTRFRASGPPVAGLPRWCAVDVWPVPGGEGRLLAVSHDDAARQRTAELEALLASAPIGIGFFDREHRWLHINDELAAINGIPAAEHLGRAVADLLPLVAPSVDPIIDRVFETGEGVANFEVTGGTPRAPGRQLHWLVGYFPVRDAAGGVIAAGAWVLEITERKRVETELMESEARYRALSAELERRVAERTRALSDTARELATEMRRREEAQAALLQSQKLEALGQLVGGVAHDFNNILHAVQGGAQLLQRGVADPKSRRLLDNMLNAADRGSRMVGQLMAFARREELRPELTDLGAMLRQCESMICHIAGPGVRCRFELAADLWPVLIDGVRLEAVLLNLAANARDAMPQGGTLTLLARNAAAGEVPPGLPARQGHVLIAVADTGSGMDAETLRRATEPFFTTKPRGKGTGLGLASAHGFASQSGGALRLRSSPGEGTVVDLFLPRAGLVAGPARAAPERREPSPALPFAARHGDATLLLADDDASVRQVTAALLRDLGYRVIEAPSAESAEALAVAEGRVDMLLTDVVMPGVSGPVLAQRLRAEWPSLPVLYLTGYGDGLDASDAPVLRKPFTDTALEAAVLTGLGRAIATAAPNPDRLRERLRHPLLRATYDRWRERGGAQVSDRLDGELAGEALEHSYLLEVLEHAQFRYRRIGRALEARLGRSLAGVVVGGAQQPGEAEMAQILGASLEAAYRRCAERATPFYDYARTSLGEDGGGTLFERLLLPLSGPDRPTHVLGLALFTELPSSA